MCPALSGTRYPSANSEILVEDIFTIDAIGIHRYLVDTIDVVDAHRDSVNI